MPKKTGSSVKKTAIKKQAKKSITKSKQSATKASKSKDWEPGYKKEIQMFKTQPDYF